MTEQEHPLEFLPELALGVLAEDDAPGIREHLATCDSCRAEYEVMTRAARLLPYAVEEVEPDASVREGLMQRIGSEPRALRPGIFRPAWQRYTAIAAAAAVLVVAGGFVGSLLTDDGNTGALKEENSRQGSLVRAMAEGNVRRDTVEQDGMSASLVYAPGTDAAFAWLKGLPELPAGKAYQAWFIADGSPKPSNVFGSAGEGVWLESPGDVAGFAAFALTIEDKGGADAPTQAPFMVMPLGAAASRMPFTIADWYALTGRE